MKLTRIGMVALILLVTSSPVLSLDESGRVQVPGEVFSMIPPKGFTKAPNFSGFFHETDLASIMINTIPSPLDEFFDIERIKIEMSKRGWKDIEAEKVTLDGRPCVFYSFKQSEKGIEVDKYIIWAGDKDKTITIMATCPRAKSGFWLAPLKNSLMSIKWSAVSADQKSDSLTFALANHGSFKHSTQFVNMLMLTEKPTSKPVPANEALFACGPSMSLGAINNPEEFSKDRLQKTDSVVDIQLDNSKPITIDGLKGFEFVAHGNDKNSKTPLLVYQVTLFPEKGFYIMQGLVSLDRKDEWLNQFQAISRSFSRKMDNASPPDPVPASGSTGENSQATDDIK